MTERAVSRARRMTTSATGKRLRRPIGVRGAALPSTQPWRTESGLLFASSASPIHFENGHGRIVQIASATRMKTNDPARIDRLIVTRDGRIIRDSSTRALTGPVGRIIGDPAKWERDPPSRGHHPPRRASISRRRRSFSSARPPLIGDRGLGAAALLLGAALGHLSPLEPRQQILSGRGIEQTEPLAVTLQVQTQDLAGQPAGGRLDRHIIPADQPETLERGIQVLRPRVEQEVLRHPQDVAIDRRTSSSGPPAWSSSR